MDNDELKRLLRGLGWSLVVLWVGSGIVVWLFTIAAPPRYWPPEIGWMNLLALALAAVTFSSFIPYYYCLGALAKRLGESRITWCGGSLLFFPFSMIVVYFTARARVEKAIDPAARTHTHRLIVTPE